MVRERGPAKLAALTGALGLIITVGGSGPCRAGVLPPLAACGEPPMLLSLSGTGVLETPPMFPRIDDCPPKGLFPWSPLIAAALLGGNGLFRKSLRVDDEEDGVRTGD